MIHSPYRLKLVAIVGKDSIMPITRKGTRGVLFAFILVGVLISVVAPQQAWAADVQAMYRLYNPYTGEHFYTADGNEKNSLTGIGWRDEGTGWTAPTKSNTPVYRLYNPYVKGGDHHYTTSTDEYNKLKDAGWRQEGIGWYSDDAKGVPLYRQYNPYAQTGTHNYTADKNENDVLVSKGWREEGIAWYGVSNASYTYEVYYLDGQGSTWYDGYSRVLYVKTDNPDASFAMAATDTKSAISRVGCETGMYEDVKDLGKAGDTSGKVGTTVSSSRPNEQVFALRVQGGYLVQIGIMPDKMGQNTIELRELGSNGATTALRLSVNVVDYDAAVTQWIDQQIARYTNNSMNPVQKMEAICAGILKEFKYLPVDKASGDRINVLSQPYTPFFVSKMWDSYESPAVLEQVANRIGGLTNVHNCYYDYDYGTAGWSRTHFNVTAEYQGKTYTFMACPLSSTNEVDLTTLPMIDFANVSQFQKAS